MLGTKFDNNLSLYNCRLRDIALAAILFWAVPAWAGEVEVGGKALAAGDYQSAYNEFRPLAERGNPSAQFNLGVMYAVGHGVKKNLAEAVKWFTLAAEQGYNNAQRNLGSMYILGQGVEQDFVKGYLWADLSAAQGDKESALLRDTLEKEMTADQIAQARKLASDWKASKN
jgi:TPR repeat protein